MDVSIVVVTWECEPELRALVGSITRHLGQRVELVVVDNASGDDPGSVLGDWHGPQRLIELDSNRGFGIAANIGVAAAEGEVVVVLNPDTELVDGSLATLARAARTRDAILGPRLLNADGSRQPSASGSPVGPWPWVGALVPGALQPRPLRARTEPWRLERSVQVAWLSGACIAARREVLCRLGPFDTSIHLYSEDMELGLRAARAGIPSIFCPDLARVVHIGGRSTSRRFAEGPALLVAGGRRKVVRQLFGPSRERRAWAAHRLNLALRAAAKVALGRDAQRERAALAAAARVKPS